MILVVSPLLTINNIKAQTFPSSYWWLATILSSNGGSSNLTIPTDGYYRITAEGGKGGSSNRSTGGIGAQVRGDFFLNGGEILDFLVGARGLDSSPEPVFGGDYSPTGGGGTFVTKKVASSIYMKYDGTYVEPLIVAGAGGAASNYDSIPGGNAGGVSNSSSPSGGTAMIAPNGAVAPGGGGFVGDGQDADKGSYVVGGGKSFLNGGDGGSHGVLGNERKGGYGGGGSTLGGGGGWRGGSGARTYETNEKTYGLGGSSYNIGANPYFTYHTNANGSLKIELGVPVEPSPTFSNVTKNSIDVTMPSENPGAITYVVEVSTDAAVGWSVVLETNNKSFTIGSLSEDTLYYVRIRLKYGSQVSPYSQTKSIKTKSAVLEAVQKAEMAAIEAKSAAIEANLQATTATDQTWDTVTGKSSATLAREARDIASNSLTSISNLESKIIDIQSYFPPSLTKVSGHNYATVTTGMEFKVSLHYSGANEYQVKLDNGSWNGWNSLTSHDTNGYITVSGITSVGVHTIYVQIRYNNGTSTSPNTNGKLTIFKL
jgi:hypothetical protein